MPRLNIIARMFFGVACLLLAMLCAAVLIFVWPDSSFLFLFGGGVFMFMALAYAFLFRPHNLGYLIGRPKVDASSVPRLSDVIRGSGFIIGFVVYLTVVGGACLLVFLMGDRAVVPALIAGIPGLLFGLLIHCWWWWANFMAKR